MVYIYVCLLQCGAYIWYRVRTHRTAALSLRAKLRRRCSTRLLPALSAALGSSLCSSSCGFEYVQNSPSNSINNKRMEFDVKNMIISLIPIGHANQYKPISWHHEIKGQQQMRNPISDKFRTNLVFFVFIVYLSKLVYWVGFGAVMDSWHSKTVFEL